MIAELPPGNHHPLIYSQIIFACYHTSAIQKGYLVTGPGPPSPVSVYTCILPHLFFLALLADPRRLQKPDQDHIGCSLFCLRFPQAAPVPVDAAANTITVPLIALPLFELIFWCFVQILLLVELLQLVNAVLKAWNQPGILQVYPQAMIPDKPVCLERCVFARFAARACINIDPLACLYPFIILRHPETDRTAKSPLNKIAARWPARAVAQFYFIDN